jgi:hypothetical protein
MCYDVMNLRFGYTMEQKIQLVLVGLEVLRAVQLVSWFSLHVTTRELYGARSSRCLRAIPYEHYSFDFLSLFDDLLCRAH